MMQELMSMELVLGDLPYLTMSQQRKRWMNFFADAVISGTSPVKELQTASWGGYSGYFWI